MHGHTNIKLEYQIWYKLKKISHISTDNCVTNYLSKSDSEHYLNDKQLILYLSDCPSLLSSVSLPKSVHKLAKHSPSSEFHSP